MKRIVSVIYFTIINLVIFAQTQYDYYEDDVAHEKPVIDGYGLLGLIMLAIIGFVVWFIYASIKEWANKHIDTTPKVKAPKPKSSIEIMKEEAEKARKKRELEWEAMEKAKLRAEAIEILKTEYNEPIIMDGVKYELKYDIIKDDQIDAFVKGYIKGCYRYFNFYPTSKMKKMFPPIVFIGYLRGLKEEKEVWEKFGKFPG
jgi:hypothetical protein